MKIIILLNELCQIFRDQYSTFHPHVHSIPIYTCDDLCRIIRDRFQSFGKGCKIIRRTEFLEAPYYNTILGQVNYFNFV